MPVKLRELLKENQIPNITEGPSIFEGNKSLSILVLQSIALQSSIDMHRANVLSLLLKINAKTVTAMLNAITSTKIKALVIKAAAKKLLDGDALKGYLALNMLADRTLDERNRFAHSLWGSVRGFEDYFFIIGPNPYLQGHAEIQEKHARGEQITQQDGLDKLNFLIDHCWMYGKPDLEELIETMTFLEQRFKKIEMLVQGPAFLKQIEFTSLLREPRIQSMLKSRQEKKSHQKKK